MPRLKLKLYKRKLHRAEDVEFMMGEISSVIRKRLLAIPERVIQRLAGKTTFQEIYALLYSEFEFALVDLSGLEPDRGRAEEYLSLILVDTLGAPQRVPDPQLCQ